LIEDGGISKKGKSEDTFEEREKGKKRSEKQKEKKKK